MRIKETALTMAIIIFFNTFSVMANSDVPILIEKIHNSKNCYDQHEVLSAYGTAQIPADRKFRGKSISVSGVVRSVWCTSDESFICLSDGKNEYYTVLF